MRPAAYAMLNLEALQHNLRKVREFAPNAKVMAVIKANAYGHGIVQVASVLQDADGFAVARVNEGIKLRQAGIQKRIAVLQGFSNREELRELARHNLDAVLHCLEQVELLEHYPGTENLSVWLKLDTGMNRLGFRQEEFHQAHQRLMQCGNVLQPLNLMTHFANADDLHDPKTAQQIELFNATTQAYAGERSIANSAGVLGWSDSLADWVRPGVMLYGISPFPDKSGRELGLKPLMSLHSRLIAVKRVEQGANVGYSGTWVCNKATLMGVAAIGYGDGYPRHLPAGTPVLINGNRAQLIGRVSMDMITVDLEACPDAKIGDLVTLWGDGLPVEEIARYADTIPYTLVCGITQRVSMVADDMDAS